MTIQPIIHTQLTNRDFVLISTSKPHVVCKVIKIENQTDSDDYAAKQTEYEIRRVIGHNIFIVYAHCMNQLCSLSKAEIHGYMDEMEIFYRTEILTHGLSKKYAIHRNKLRIS